MSQVSPKFSQGNRHFADALNEVVDYAKRHGLNPKGVPGYTETPDGWMPLFSIGTVSGQSNWDLVPVETDAALNRFKVHKPMAIKPRELPPSFLAVTYQSTTHVALTAASYIVAKITSLSTPAIEIAVVAKASMESSGIYTFSGATMTEARIPLWYFDTTAGTYSVPVSIGEGEADVLHGTKLVAPSPLKVVYNTAIDGGDYKLVIDLI